jgi:bifunctional ADP-heptose synthase (sugar kinase/adenylyltransferase)
MPIFRIEKEEYRLAGTGNIIRNLLLMNLAVDVISVIGNNDKIVLDLLKDMKLDMYGITRSQNYCVKTITRYFCNKRLCPIVVDTSLCPQLAITIQL